jgi:hypothetical protein
MKDSTVSRVVVVLATVSLAASGAMAADRVVLNEHFTASW